MIDKKIVRKSVAIALRIICIILVAGLGGAMAYYMMAINNKNSQLNTLTNENNQLQTWLDGNMTSLIRREIWLADNITHYNSQINSLNSQITGLTNGKNQLQTWLNGNITGYEKEISSLNAQINQLQTWLDGNITSYDTLNTQYASLQDQLTGVLGIKNGTWLAYLDHLAITNYSYTNNGIPLSWSYTGIIDVYNYGANCTANIEIYGPSGNTVTFDLAVPAGYAQFVETWSSGTYQYSYANITILSVQR